MPVHAPTGGGIPLPIVDNVPEVNKLREARPSQITSARPKLKVNEWWVNFPGELQKSQFAHMPGIDWEKLYRLRKYGTLEPSKASLVGEEVS